MKTKEAFEIAKGLNTQKADPRCPNCGSAAVLYKKKTKTQWCRKCGKEWKAAA